MKVFVADTDSLSISKLERSLSMSGFACEKAIISGKVQESLFHYLVNGFKGVVVLGAGLDDDLKESWIRQCRKSEAVFPDLFLRDQPLRDGARLHVLVVQVHPPDRALPDAERADEHQKRPESQSLQKQPKQHKNPSRVSILVRCI